MQKNLNLIIWISTLFVLGIGLAALFSASVLNVRVTDKVFYDQLLCVVFGIILMYYLSRVDYRIFYDAAYLFYLMNIILLVLVFVTGRHVLGAQRWIELGPFNFQPSEITKLAMILFLGRYFSQIKISLSSAGPIALFRELLAPLMLTAIPMLLIFRQPDLGTSILIFGIFFVMLFVSGINHKIFLGFTAICLSIVPFAWNILKPYQKDRLLVFLNPNIDPLGAGYTIIQSKIAIGSGQIFGRGWLAGTQNQLNFLPERHTDFIFSVIGEEWGLVGTTLLLLCYFVIIYCGLKTAEQVKDNFGTFVTIGIVTILTLQVIINMGMVLGLLPVVGLTLPFISYGRTSLIIFFIMMGFLLNLSKRRTVF